MKTRFIALIALAAFGATFVGCAAKTGTNLGRAIDGNGYYEGYDGYYTGDYYGITDGYYNNTTGDYRAYGTGYNGGLSGTMYGDDSGYSTYMNNSYRQGVIENNLGTDGGRTYSTLYGD